MTCDQALDRMLEADPAELAAGLAESHAGEPVAGDGELVNHIRSCSRCADVARTIRSELEALDSGLDALGREGGTTGAVADAAADAALAAIRPEGGPEVVPIHGPRGAPPEGRAEPVDQASWTRRAWVPLAAAAALAGVLVVGQRERPLPPSDAVAQTETIDPRVSVVPPADRGAAIMETENPNITIVWLYEREES